MKKASAPAKKPSAPAKKASAPAKKTTAAKAPVSKMEDSENESEAEARPVPSKKQYVVESSEESDASFDVNDDSDSDFSPKVNT